MGKLIFVLMFVYLFINIWFCFILECYDGMYGLGCKEMCGYCFNGLVCLLVNGFCEFGCELGYCYFYCKESNIYIFFLLF